MKIAVLLLPALVLLACAASVREPQRPPENTAHFTVFLIGHGWHSGLAIRRSDISPGLWPESADFPEAQFLEVGWGDWDFYQASDFNLWLMVKAGLWSTASVLYVAGLRYPVGEYYPCSDVIELAMSKPHFERLLGYIHNTFARGVSGRVFPLSTGKPQIGRFYPARGHFTLFTNCNVWTAKALGEAGYPMHTPYPITAGSLITRATRFGRQVAPQGGCAQSRLGSRGTASIGVAHGGPADVRLLR